MEAQEKFPRTDRISISNTAISASYRINTLEKRALLAMAANIDTQILADINLDEINLEQYLNEQGTSVYRFCKNRVSVSNFAEALGIKGSNRGDMVSEVKRVCYSLMQRVVNLDCNSYEDYSKQKGRFHYVHWVEECALDETGQFVDYRLSEAMIPVFLALKSHFTKLYFSAERDFKRDTTMRFYELFSAEWGKAYCKDNDVLPVRITLNDFRRYFDLDDRYNPVARDRKVLYCNDDGSTNFKALNQWLIKPAIKELQEKSEFVVETKNIRDGRKVVALEFLISKTSKNDLELEEELSKLRNKLVKLEVPSRLVEVLLKRYEADTGYLLYGCEYCFKLKNKNNRKQEIEDYDNYLTAALASEWLRAKFVTKVAEDERKKKLAAERKALKEGKAVQDDAGNIRMLSDEEISAKSEAKKAVDAETEQMKKAFYELSAAEQKEVFELVVKQNGTLSRLLSGKEYDEIWNSSAFSGAIRSATKTYIGMKKYDKI